MVGGFVGGWVNVRGLRRGLGGRLRVGTMGVGGYVGGGGLDVGYVEGVRWGEGVHWRGGGVSWGGGGGGVALLT